jgi:hypothetical protein
MAEGSACNTGPTNPALIGRLGIVKLVSGALYVNDYIFVALE